MLMFLLISFADDACCSHNLTSSIALPAQGWLSPTQTRGEDRNLFLKERAAGAEEKVTVQMEEEQRGGIKIQITMTGTACLL